MDRRGSASLNSLVRIAHRAGSARHYSPEFDQEIECADLDEALTHLRELITSEMAAPPHDGPHFERYGVRVD